MTLLATRIAKIPAKDWRLGGNDFSSPLLSPILTRSFMRAVRKGQYRWTNRKYRSQKRMLLGT
jgi:hypothetical protein